MPLSSRRLKWYCNTAMTTCDLLPSLRFTEDQTVKASRSRVLRLSAADSEGTTLTESRIKDSSLGGGGGGKPRKFHESRYMEFAPTVRTHGRRVECTL